MRFILKKANQPVTLTVAFLIIFCCNRPLHAQDLFELMQTDGVKLSYVQDVAQKHFDQVGRGKGSGYKLYKRWEHSAQLRLQADGRMYSLKEQAKLISKAKADASKSGNKDAASWQELGPLSWEVTSGYAPGVGRITALAVEPTQQQLIYAGSPGGGLWKSTNGGNSWVPLGDQFRDMQIWAAALDPQVSNRLYIADNTGLLVSNDGGATFSPINSLLNTGKITTILVDPNNSNVLYVAMRYVGLYKSTDGGSSWTKIISSTVEDIKYKPGNTNVLYACGDKFYRSTDGGTTFTHISSGIQANRRMKLDVTPADTNVVFIVQDYRDSTNTNQFGYLYRSTDGGSNFSVQIDHTNGTDFIGRQSSRDMAIAVSNTNPSEVHIGGLHMYKSVDAGLSFTRECHWVYGETKLGNPSKPHAYVHADIEIIEYINGQLYVGSDGGLFRSGNQGVDFTDLSTGMGIHQLYRIGNSANSKDLMASGAQDNGLNMMVGSQFKWRHWYGADGMECWIHPTNDSIQYAATQFGYLIKTDDGGFSRYRPVKPFQHGQGNWLTPMAVDVNNGNRLYVGYDTLYRHDNAGNTTPWVNCSQNFQFASKLSHIELCPSNSNVIYVATQGFVYKSTNILSANPTWTYMPGTIGGNVNDVAVDPFDENRVAVATSVGFVYLSENGGQTWSRLDSALPTVPFKSLVFDRTGNRGMYLATDGAIYYRNDNLGHWTIFSNNLPNVETRELELFYGAPGENRLRVATYGRGVWETPLYEDILAGVDIVKDKNPILVYPNPVSEQLRIQVRTMSGIANVRMFDISGKQVLDIDYSTYDGLNLLKLPVQDYAAGSYILQLNLPDKTLVTRKVAISR